MSDTPKSVVLVEVKPFWQSKTIWINALTILGAFLLFLMGSSEAGQLPFPLDLRWVVFIQGVINLALRFLTTAPVTGGSKG